ncbi:MAG: GNAT family N-acetyltransferase [Actinobacteria bacterium]|nr:GNAT family N-acetyltransferase [Actinomycetota bacterium]
MAELLTIGEFARRCGLSAKVLRTYVYAELGVLVPTVVDTTSGYRYYDAAQVREAEIVRLLRRAGVAVADIGSFLADPSTADLDGWERALAAEVLGRRQALSELRWGVAAGPVQTRGATVIEIGPVADRYELEAVFELLGAQLPQPLGAHDWRADDLVARFPLDQSLMLVARQAAEAVGGALAFRHDNGTVTLRIIAVVGPFRHRGIGRLLAERIEAQARLLAAARIALGTDETVGFWYHLGYTPFLLLQWVYDAELYEQEAQVVMAGPLAGLDYRRSSFNRRAAAVCPVGRTALRPARPTPGDAHRVPCRVHDVEGTASARPTRLNNRLTWATRRVAAPPIFGAAGLEPRGAPCRAIGDSRGPSTTHLTEDASCPRPGMRATRAPSRIQPNAMATSGTSSSRS